MGVLLWRGFSIDKVMSQCFGNEEDTSGKGRQMPVVRFMLYKLCYFTLSSSTLDRQNTIFTLFLRHSLHRFPKQLVLAMPFDGTPIDVRNPSQHAFSEKVLLLKGVCCPTYSHLLVDLILII